MRRLVIFALLLALGGCVSTEPKPRWEMYRLDKHYRPYRVHVSPVRQRHTTNSWTKASQLTNSSNYCRR